MRWSGSTCVPSSLHPLFRLFQLLIPAGFPNLPVGTDTTVKAAKAECTTFVFDQPPAKTWAATITGMAGNSVRLVESKRGFVFLRTLLFSQAARQDSLSSPPMSTAPCFRRPLMGLPISCQMERLLLPCKTTIRSTARTLIS